jgi:hypothetical protein
VAQACNPNYSGGGEWEDWDSRPAGAKSSPDPISTNGWAWCICLSSQLHRETHTGGSQSRTHRQKVSSTSKITSAERAGGMAQVVTDMASKHTALSSISSTTKNNNKNQNYFESVFYWIAVVCVCIYIYVCVCIYIYIYIYICIYIYIYICVCVYIYIYIHTHIFHFLWIADLYICIHIFYFYLFIFFPFAVLEPESRTWGRLGMCSTTESHS